MDHSLQQARAGQRKRGRLTLLRQRDRSANPDEDEGPTSNLDKSNRECWNRQ